MPRLHRGMYPQSMPVLALNQAVADELNDLRVNAELSMRQVADRSGIPEVSIQRYLTGKRPIRVDHLALIAAALGSDPTALFADAVARVKREN